MKKGLILSPQKPWGKSPKSFILTGILLSVFLFATVALAELTDWEAKVCYDLYETMLFNSISENAAYAQVANKYSTTVDALKNIEAKAEDEEPTDWEVGVYRDLVKRLAGLPQRYLEEDAKSIYTAVASKYGIRRGQVHVIEHKCFAWDVPF